ncbi:transporter, major facilitator family protein [Slackia exigua ATCC 700122]|uniref:Transporter, major facilitator family protein n=2 Tax=Slackia TaxID=84108 RepID=D0WIB1_SLAES|nr:transporter, major facilitator family protein [Slackia exigua ATCC 700122]
MGKIARMTARKNATERSGGDALANYLTMTGHVCSDINQGALSAVLPFLVVGSGYSYFEATMLVFAANIASAVIQPLFGWLGDKHPSPWLMALGVFIAGLGMAGIGYVQEHGYWWVVASATVSGIGVAMFHPEGGRLSNLAAGERKGNGMSIFAVGGNIGFFIGPILCAIFVSTFGLHGTAVFLAPATVCAMLLLGFNGRFKALGTAASPADGDSTAREHWGLFGIVMGVLTMRSILHYGLMAFIPLFLVGMLGQSEVLSSTAISVFSIAAALATAFSGRVAEKTGTIRLMTTCCVLMGIGIVGFAFNGIVAVAFILTLVLAVALDLFYPSAVALGMGYVPRHLGMASGLSYGIAVCAGGMVEPLLGLEGDAIGLVPVMLALAAVSFLAAFLCVMLKRLSSV